MKRILFAATAVAVLAATRQISGWWLGAPLTALCLWSDAALIVSGDRQRALRQLA